MPTYSEVRSKYADNYDDFCHLGSSKHCDGGTSNGGQSKSDFNRQVG